MKKYTTPVLTQYNTATEGLMTTMSLPTPGSGSQSSGGAQTLETSSSSQTTPGRSQTFEKQFSIWGDDQSADESDDMDFNSTGIF